MDTIPAGLVERLAQHRTLAGAPPDELDWLTTHGRIIRLERGDVLTPKTGPVGGLYILLSGDLSIHVDRGDGPFKVMEWHPGDVTGILPYSRIVAPPGDVTVDAPAEILAIDRDLVPDLIRACPEITGRLVHVMLDRARRFTSADIQNEKMSSLGKLAAGLAHELNNPASAVVRSADGLAVKLVDVEASARAFGAVPLTPAQNTVIARARSLCLAAGGATAVSGLERADREEAITDWLVRHNAESIDVDALVDSAATIEVLDQLSASLGNLDHVRLALHWLIAECAAQHLVREVHTAADRIYKLVAAVKGFTYMDQGQAQQPVNVGQGLRDSLTILESKARARSIVTRVDIDPDLPSIQGFGGALNQVWANLIDNAIDAGASEVTVSAARNGSTVVIRVVDDGHGIPAEVQKRMFDPFYTTKPPGKGVGLGLDTVRRIVREHRGEIAVESRPGRTEFIVTLPIAAGR